MIFVPLPLFVTFVLVFVLARMLITRDMTLRTHQLMAGLIALYTLQSLLSCLRWGYEIEGAATWVALLAPCLPAVAYLAYLSLAQTLSLAQLWPLGVIIANWAALLVYPPSADPLIMITYLGFGTLLLLRASRGGEAVAHSAVNDVAATLMAMRLTAVVLIASGLTDIYLIVDFIRNEGQNAGLVVTFVHTGFVLLVGLCAALGRSTPAENTTSDPLPAMGPTQEDGEIIARLTQLFETESLHKDEDLSLRRLSRRAGLPDRAVSGAINRTHGLNLSQFVNTFRVRDACVLLQDTDMSVLEVSLAAGFATKSNFNREFNRVTGQTPSGWRKANRG